MRRYDIHLTNANDDVIAFWSKLDEVNFVTVITTMVPLSGYHVSVYITLEG
jgi:hypothetical protein